MIDLSKAQLASLLMAQGETQQAIDTLNSSPQDEACLVLLRELYIGENDLLNADPIMQQMAETEGAEGLVSASILALIEKDLNAAVRLAEQAIQDNNQSATAHNHLGRALQNSGQSGKAIKAFKSATRINPNYAQAWHNLGHTRRALGVMDEAASHYRKAIDCYGGYQSAWFNLAITLSVMERHNEAMTAFEQLLKINKQHILGWVNKGLAHHVLGQYDAAIDCYDRAMDLDPELAMVYSYKGVLLNELQQSEQAIRCLKHALSLDPNEVDAWCELCDVYEKTNQLTQAEQANQQALTLNPHHPTALIDAARMDKRNRQFSAAMAKLDQVQVAALPVRKATEYWFERGDIADKAGQYKVAWQAYQQANNLARQSPRFQTIDQHAFDQRLTAIEQQLTHSEPIKRPSFWQRLTGQSTQSHDSSVDPKLGARLCFLVGFPRSGTTLIDTILSVSDQVTSIEEKPTIEMVIKHLEQQGLNHRDQAFAEAADWNELRTVYWSHLEQQDNSDDAGLIVDKLPLRFLESEFIRQLFPAAKFLFMLRHPSDVIISNYMQNYVPTQAFVHFSRIEDAVAMYTDCMALWQQLAPRLGDRLLILRYEELVSRAESSVDKLCQFLDIPFNPDMLATDQRLASRSRISTNSYAQVAEGINQKSVNRHQHYTEQLALYDDALRPMIKALGY